MPSPTSSTRSAWSYILPLSSLIFLGEFALSLLIVRYVPYTEIDWKAYMQEVGGVLNGTLDYIELRGDTGPLVYPGMFVWIYSLFHYFTDGGAQIAVAQYVFLILYMVVVVSVLYIYSKARTVPVWALVLLFLSRRIHSIFMLRLFNDGIAMLFLFFCIALLMKRQYSLASISFSLGVGVKMNIFLFAPALFVVLLRARGFLRTLGYIALCGVVQVLVGLPFLLHNWRNYLMKSFELGRIFEQKWSVNFQMLPEETFTSPILGLCLLFATIIVWLVLLHFVWLKDKGGLIASVFSTGMALKLDDPPAASFILDSFALSNFVGIVFSRSIHYQFYVWYFHFLPHLLWRTPFPTVVRLALFAAFEYVYTIYPPTVLSSWLLQLAHISVLCGVLYSSVVRPFVGNKVHQS